MRIETILQEGLMQVPEEALLRASSAVASEYVTRVFKIITDVRRRAVIRKVLNKYTNRIPYFDQLTNHSSSKPYITKILLDLKTLPKNYKARGKAEIILHAGPMFPKSEYQIFHNGPSHVYIKTPSDEDIESINDNVRDFEHDLVNLLGLVRHEFMHGIQEKVFNKDFSDVTYYKDDDSIDMDDYFTTPTEFEPFIVTSAHNFVAMLREQIGSLNGIDPIHIKNLVKKFTSPKQNKQTFFKALYEKDVNRWKKAVKYFYITVKELIGNENEI